MADLNISTLTSEENGIAEDVAEQETFTELQDEFPRLKAFDAVSDETHI